MKRTVLTLALAAMIGSVAVSCGEKQEESAKSNAKKEALAAAQGNLPNYRFVDMDSIMLKYNLCLDFNEQMLVLQNQLSDEEKRQTNSLNQKGESFQKRYQAASQQPQPSESEMNALQKEYENIQNLQTQAQQKLAKMGADLEETQMKNLQTVMDSVQNFLKDYAAKHGYDAVFFSNAAPYANPALDVTDEVVEGLNKRYNKVK